MIPEEITLFRAAQAGDVKARNTIVAAYLGLVRSYARGMAQRGRGDFGDLVAAGVAGAGRGTSGLIRAIERFDLDRGLQFTTFAVPWIKVGMREWIAQEASTLSLQQSTRVQLIRRMQHQLRNELDREPTHVETSDALNSHWEAIGSATRTRPLTVERLCLSAEAAQERCATEDNGPNFMCPRPGIEQLIHNLEVREMVRAAVMRLPERERQVVTLRYGLGVGGGEMRKFAEVAEAMGLSVSRIEQISAAALKRLKPKLAEALHA